MENTNNYICHFKKSIKSSLKSFNSCAIHVKTKNILQTTYESKNLHCTTVHQIINKK